MTPGKLLLIGTPIGNLGDASPRAIEAMRSCSRLLCEDTRHTRKLLTHFGIATKLESFHEHNENEKTGRVIDAILGGETVGLVSDAGLPVVSDPGYALVREALRRGIRVEPIPGAFAGVLALAASGITPLPFTFYGFAPHRSGERREFYRSIAARGTTAIVYESPQRVAASLRDARAELGNTEVTVAREMTKLHEEFLHGSLDEILDRLAGRKKIQGEITIVFAPAVREQEVVGASMLRAEFQRLRQQGLRRTDAIKMIAQRYQIDSRKLYRMLLEESGG